MPFAPLLPRPLWQHFATLCAIPRPSKHEHLIRQHLCSWADRKGLAHAVDAAGNLLIRKPAAPGMSGAPALALQAHLDMVCQARSGIAHDFLQAPIRPRLDGNWLCADDTTLGADNGIGVALALAALEDETLHHGPLEVLLTVDEEAGMGGAQGLQADWLTARVMLNLDTEGWGEFYVGCAGSCDVNVSGRFPVLPVPADRAIYAIDIGDLRGGHSGCDIHLQRGNANRLIAEALAVLAGKFAPDMRLISLIGGTARNALPREASAIVALPSASRAEAQQCLDDLGKRWQAALVSEQGEETVSIHLAATSAPGMAIEISVAQRLIAALGATPYGVRKMSDDFPGVVDTSNNLGIVALTNGHFSANLMVRSLRDRETGALAEAIASTFREAGCRVSIDAPYPGWTPNPASPLLALCQRVYRQTFATDSAVRVIHAGLECGIIGARYPGMDIVSFGPDIRGAHAPGERVDIASVERCWHLLRALIGEIARA